MSVPAIEKELLIDRELRAQVVAGDIRSLVPEFKAAMAAGNTSDVLRILRLGVAAKPDLLTVYHELVFPPLAAIGASWARGETTVDIEHLASQSIREALARLQSELYHKPANGKTALLACHEHEQHDLPLRCVNQYLTSEGWRTLFLGPQTPTDSLVFSINRNRPDLVVMTSIVIEDERRFIHDVNHEIVPALRKLGGRLAIGGPGVARRFTGVLKADFLSESILEYARIGDARLMEAVRA
jgi:methanogenic corrinoid protein MtbC1